MAAGSSSISAAFLRQAKSDLDADEALVRHPLPTCHKLHYLQMWLEKLCKAHLHQLAETRDDLPLFETSHKVIAKALLLLIRQHWRAAGYETRPEKQELKTLRGLCEELDFLHPAIHQDGKRSDNVEYPWAEYRNAAVVFIAPADFAFRVDERLKSPLGKKLLKAAKILTNSENVIASLN